MAMTHCLPACMNTLRTLLHQCIVGYRRVFLPEIDIEFTDAEGAPVEENFRFHNVGDFSVKKMTEQSHFLSGLNTEKQFADRMEKSLRSNKVLQRVLENPATREAFVNSLSAMLDDLKKNEKSNPANE